MNLKQIAINIFLWCLFPSFSIWFLLYNFSCSRFQTSQILNHIANTAHGLQNIYYNEKPCILQKMHILLISFQPVDQQTLTPRRQQLYSDSRVTIFNSSGAVAQTTVRKPIKEPENRAATIHSLIFFIQKLSSVVAFSKSNCMEVQDLGIQKLHQIFGLDYGDKSNSCNN